MYTILRLRLFPFVIMFANIYDTWCKKVDAGRPEEHYIHWLKKIHILPTVVPNARIMG